MYLYVKCGSIPLRKNFQKAWYLKKLIENKITNRNSVLFSESMCLCLHTHNYGTSYGEGNGTPLQYAYLENPMDGGAWWAAVHGVSTSRTWLSDFTFTFHFHALEKEMVTHSSVLAWRIPGTGEPSGLPSMGSHRVGHDWSDLAAVFKYSANFIKPAFPYFQFHLDFFDF